MYKIYTQLMDFILIGASVLTTFLIRNKIMNSNSKIINSNSKSRILYDKKCIEKCNLPVPRCPYEACRANCRRENCASRCSNMEKKPLTNCIDYCKELEHFKTKSGC